MISCSACQDPATIKLGNGHALCGRCFEIFRREYPGLNFPVASSLGNNVATVTDPGPGSSVTVATNSFDDGIPAFLLRDKSNVPAFARAT